MKRFFLFLLPVFFGGSLSAQFVYTIKADSVKITSCDSAELIIENHTQGVPGFLFNTGNGRTVFKRALVQLDDTTFLLGGDTLRASMFSFWKANGSSIYNINTGNVGIHRDTPAAMLDLPGPVSIDDTSAYRINYHPILAIGGWLSSCYGMDPPCPYPPNAGAYTNLYIGDSTGSNNPTTSNTFIGSRAGEYSSGGSNAFLGANAGQGDQGWGNAYFGAGCGLNTTGSTNSGENSFFGASTGLNSSGMLNTFLGYYSGEGNSGDENVIVGAYGGTVNTGDYNSFFGFASGENNNGGRNSFFGVAAGGSHVGTDNIIIGDGAGESGNGNNNIFIGNSTGTLIYGDGNVFLGTFQTAGSNETENNLTLIGYGTSVGSAGITDATAIGSNSLVNASNTMVFGDGNVSTWLFNMNATATSGAALVVGSNSTNGNGAYLTTGGVWTNASDRSKKENFKSLNDDEILSKIDALPITRWNYKGLPEQHIGPVAQDFYKIFQVGTDDKTISTIDPSGIALAGIQGLYDKWKEAELRNREMKAQLQQQQTILSAQQTQINQLLERLSSLETALNKTNPEMKNKEAYTKN